MKTATHLHPAEKRRRAAAEPDRKRDAASGARFGDQRSTAVSQKALAASVSASPMQRAQQQRLQGMFGPAAQLQAGPEEEELQMKSAAGALQREGPEEELLQGKNGPAQRLAEEEEPLQAKFAGFQRVEEDEPLQGKVGTAQPEEAPASMAGKTGLPGDLKVGIESLSGLSMDHVKVHYNSSQPAQVNALAYAQGTDIHVAPGQERHLPHEAWHIVQQAQGRVQPTMQMRDGVPVNDDEGLEHEADVMGARALSLGTGPATPQRTATRTLFAPAQFVRRTSNGVVQRAPVAVGGGTFEVINEQYLATDGPDSKGAVMWLRFDPNNGVGALGDTISLVQTVQDTTRRWDQEKDVTIAPTTSQLGHRTLQSGEPGVDAGDVGTGIDQEVQNEQEITNLDPRYTERRLNATAPLELGTSMTKRARPESIRSAKKKTDVEWTHAALNDEPNVSTRILGSSPPRRATVTGGMQFEVAALHNEQNQFLGSVTWGWQMEGPSAVLNPAQLTLEVAGRASARFFKAAAKWNRTAIVDPAGGASLPTMQLPTSSSSSSSTSSPPLSSSPPSSPPSSTTSSSGSSFSSAPLRSTIPPEVCPLAK